VKDNLGTEPSLGMKTTAGSYALEDSVVKQVSGDFSGWVLLVERRFLEWDGVREVDIDFSVGLYSGFGGVVGCDSDKASTGQWGYHLR
jgi:hypothetical protein